VRRNRRRFWKSEDDQDKFTAYATLYHVLVNTIKCIAPVLPFCTEKMYDNLVASMDPNAPKSVHLCDYPEEDEKWIDMKIIKKVDALKRMVELGRYARNQSKQKIRQPLMKVLFALEDNDTADFIMEHSSIVLDELNVKSIERITNADSLVTYIIKPNLPILGKKYSSGLKTIIEILKTGENDERIKEYESTGNIVLDTKGESFVLEKEDIIIDTVATEGFSAVSGAGITVGLKLELNEDLIQEGIVRDLVRQVQNIRRDAGFAVEDRISIWWDLGSEFGSAFSKFKGYFCNETLTIAINNVYSEEGYNTVINLRGKKIRIAISKTHT
jgi:isoleucyl-tRNA synthetase